MKREKVSKITCVTAASLGPSVLSALEDLGIPETYIQSGKQVSLVEKGGPFGFFPRVELEDAGANIYRFYAPHDRAEEVCTRVVDSASLILPGRGSLFVEKAELACGWKKVGASDPAVGEKPRTVTDAIKNLLKPATWLQDYTALTCIVQRGQGDLLARTVLEMGLCVPVVSFGSGMGLRNKLGLLRITIPVEKEVIYFLVPAADANLVESIAVHKARLDRPGQGFIYRCRVQAATVNARISRTRRRHVATMEQVISAVDRLQGSTDWRRRAAPAKGRGTPSPKGPPLVCLSISCEEGRVGDFVRTAMDTGAGGATLMRLGYRDLPKAPVSEKDGASAQASHAREICDLIIQEDQTEKILAAMEERGLFEPDVYGMAEITTVEKAVTYRS